MDTSRHNARRGLYRPQLSPRTSASLLYDPTRGYLQSSQRDNGWEYLDWRGRQLPTIRQRQNVVPQYQVNNGRYSQNIVPRYLDNNLQYSQQHVGRYPIVQQPRTPVGRDTRTSAEIYADFDLSDEQLAIRAHKKSVTPKANLANPYLQELMPKTTAPIETKLLAFLVNHLHKHVPALVLLKSRMFHTFGDEPTTLYAKNHEARSPETSPHGLSCIHHGYSEDGHPLFIENFRTEIRTFRYYNNETRQTRYRLEAKVSCWYDQYGESSMSTSIVVEKTLPARPKSQIEGMSFEDILGELKRASFVTFDVLGQKRVVYERVRIERNLKGKERKAGRVRAVAWEIVA